MQKDTETDPSDGRDDGEPLTSGHVERTILHYMAGEPPRPATVGAVSAVVGAVIERGGYANLGPSTAADGTVRKSTIRRAFGQLREKGLVRRVEELSADDLRSGRYDLGELSPDGDPADPAAYAGTSDDARVTDWVLTEAGSREVERLDARYAAELEQLAARYGRPHGETTTRIDA